MQFLAKKNQIELQESQVRELKDFADSGHNIKPYGAGRGANEPLFMYMWTTFPETRKMALSVLFGSAPTEYKKYRSSVSETLSRYHIEAEGNGTYIELLLSNWGDYLKENQRPVDFAKWITELQQKFEQRLRLGEFHIQELKLKFETGVKITEASAYWKNLGVKRLETRVNNVEQQVLVNGRWLRCEVDNQQKTIRILAPRDMVGRAAWNPLYTEVLIAKMAGHRTLAKYPAFLATNGIFYLSDGNHRFALDTRQEVWVEMSFSATTSSMSISFDAIGLRQPPTEDLVRLQNNETTLEDLIGSSNAARIIYR